MKYAAHDDMAIYAVGISRSDVEEKCSALEGDQHLERFEYEISECTERLYREVLDNGTPKRWVLTDDCKMDLDIDEDEEDE